MHSQIFSLIFLSLSSSICGRKGHVQQFRVPFSVHPHMFCRKMERGLGKSSSRGHVDPQTELDPPYRDILTVASAYFESTRRPEEKNRPGFPRQPFISISGSIDFHRRTLAPVHSARFYTRTELGRENISHADE